MSNKVANLSSSRECCKENTVHPS